MAKEITRGAFGVIMRDDHRLGRQVLMDEREDGKGLDLLGGRVEPGESLSEAVIREVFEESGLDVVAVRKFDNDFVKRDESGDILDISYLFLVEVCGGELATTPETIGFKWVSLEALGRANVVYTPCPGYPRGVTYAMAELALRCENPVFSNVQDPHDLATDQCAHIRTQRQHICIYSINCSQYNCFGDDNSEICLSCGEDLMGKKHAGR